MGALTRQNVAPSGAQLMSVFRYSAGCGESADNELVNADLFFGGVLGQASVY